MKNLAVICLTEILICSFCVKISAQPSSEQYSQNNLEYTFGAYKLNKERYIKNIRINVAEYINRQGWENAYREEFINAYEKLLNALTDTTDPYRLYTNEFGSIIDTKGELGNNDEDDFWYDKKGNKITGNEYRMLKEKKKKQYHTFSANRAVATYFYKVAKALVKKMESENNGF